jgi:hypothetical protein
VQLPADGNLVTDGSFENYNVGVDGYNTISDGAQGDGWAVNPGSVDILGAGWQAANGSNSADLNGDIGPGTLTQNLPTQPGQSYTLHFSMAQACVNGGSPGVTKMTASWDGGRLGQPTFDGSATSPTAMG